MWRKCESLWPYKEKSHFTCHIILNTVKMQLLNCTFTLEITISVTQGKIKMWAVIHPFKFLPLPYLHRACHDRARSKLNVGLSTVMLDLIFTEDGGPLESLSDVVSCFIWFSHLLTSSSPSSLRRYRSDGMSNHMCEIGSKFDGFLCLWV